MHKASRIRGGPGKGCTKRLKGQAGALSSRYALDPGKGRTARVYCMQLYPAFSMQEAVQLELVTSWSHRSTERLTKKVKQVTSKMKNKLKCSKTI